MPRLSLLPAGFAGAPRTPGLVLTLAMACSTPAPEAYPGLAYPAQGVMTEEVEAVGDGSLADEMRRVPLTMYVTSWCPHCTRARRWLIENGYDYEELDVEEDELAARDLATLNPRSSVPTFDIDGHVVRGFEPGQLEAAIRRVARRRLASEATMQR